MRVRRGRRGAGRYQYYKLHDGLHPGNELKKDWMEMILTDWNNICYNKMYLLIKMYKGVVKLVDIKAAFIGCVGELQCTS